MRIWTKTKLPRKYIIKGSDSFGYSEILFHWLAKKEAHYKSLEFAECEIAGSRCMF